MKFTSMFRRSRENGVKPSGGPPSIEESKREAAQQHLAKESKIQVAEQAVWLEDLREVAWDNRNSYQRYRDKKVGDKMVDKKPGDALGDLTVADNITHEHHYHPTPKPAKKNGSLLRAAVIGASLLGGGGMLGVAAMQIAKNLFPFQTTVIENTTTQDVDIVPEVIDWIEP